MAATSNIPLVARRSISENEELLREALPRHRHDLPRDAVRASQAARVLIATSEVVAAKGYAGTTVRDITREAGVSQKTFYELFENKEDAFLAAYAAIDLVIERMMAAGLDEGEPRAMVEAGIRAFLETLASEPAFTRMLVIEAVGAGSRVLERRARAFRDFASVLAIPIQRARERDPEIPAADEALLTAVLGGINELVLQHLIEGEPDTLTDLLPTAVRLVERACLEPGPAPKRRELGRRR
jgi:AcrR family transcriptional regulator